MTKNYAQGIVPSTPQDDCSQEASETATQNGDARVKKVKRGNDLKLRKIQIQKAFLQSPYCHLLYCLEMSECGVCFLGSTRWSWSHRDTERRTDVLGVLAEVQCCWTLIKQEH